MVAVLLSIGWIIQVCFWCHCDYAPDSNTCYQYYITGSEGSQEGGSLYGVSDGVTAVKVVLGLVVLTL